MSRLALGLAAMAGGVGCATSSTVPENLAPIEVAYSSFLREVYEPTCSGCHSPSSNLPDWGQYDVARAACSAIEARVLISQTMPPADVAFSDAQRSIVQAWTEAGCPNDTPRMSRLTDPSPAPIQMASGGAPAEMSPAEATPPAAAASVTDPCPSYEDHFLPLVHVAVCDTCHGRQSGLPDWSVLSVAQASCSRIEQNLETGNMPPPSSGIVLDDAVRTMALRWTALGCPDTTANAELACAAQGGAPVVNLPAVAGGNGNGTEAPPAVVDDNGGGDDDAPPAAGALTVSIERARWEEDDQVLEVRGQVSDPAANLTLEFLGRTQAITNSGGEFREEIGGVAANPGTVTVRAESGGVVVETELSVEVR